MAEFESDSTHRFTLLPFFFSLYSGTFKWMYRCTSAFHKIRSIIFMNAWHIINGALEVRGCILWNSRSSWFVRPLSAYFTVVRRDVLYDLSLYPLLWRSVRTYWWVIYRTINHSTMRKAASITHTAQTMKRWRGG